jgi:hypothetical protein
VAKVKDAFLTRPRPSKLSPEEIDVLMTQSAANADEMRKRLDKIFRMSSGHWDLRLR